MTENIVLAGMVLLVVILMNLSEKALWAASTTAASAELAIVKVSARWTGTGKVMVKSLNGGG